MRSLLEKYDPVTRRTTRVTVDPDSGLPLIQYVQDVRPLIEANKRQASNFDKHRARKADWVHVARIPMPEWIKLMRLGITKDEKALNGYLNMRECKAFRCDDGRTL